MPLRPTREQIEQLSNSPLEGPVVMLNLLRFERDGAGGGTGEATYRRYGEELQPLLERTGGRVIWSGRADSVVIGDDRDRWDAVILVEYPSRKAFLEMASSSEYAKVGEHRTSALADSRLIAMTEQFRRKD